ncbi:TatA/E family twin arginine-targeting protein translocase [Lyngbya confervoides]|uniref:Sec-independent protein translocase protein TatA n=1 Tax=Lyngbya confervoides BDU141951 TaxID=1574623 RepID=A0ABD4T315_9CYAN|nr:TatA/E family twin arginine-targeting protein translocase [Lyngbya confervoides]MCM1982735.1 TatA/E family twin arginine-targeting protein translocase [Lyngbya confervoides BDU141951]
MNIFGIGLPEMVLIFIVALLIFGPKKLPEIGRSLGKTLRSFQDASKEFEAEIKREVERSSTSDADARPMEARLEERDPPQLVQGEMAPSDPGIVSSEGDSEENGSAGHPA